MRLWLIVFLAILMPLQLSWAATGRYCQHESDVSSKHVGHHTHQHQVTERTESGGDLAKTISVDMDCGTCHACCSVAVHEPDVVKKIALTLMLAPLPSVQSSPGPEDRPERPQWDALV
ncbi:hypothetical protein [Rhodoferax sp.]|uniref:hypothetical protein n=1 Tax=Rhodoferax sp. TaxID=50421 RepID=UPI002606744F|nr:hypothetical protein [Rhodoferax sp.]MDD2810341.1 hypothetical protein [Rhodoferax sp.]MDD4943265.1 hypothetical protein [Rhodoferax sp.]HOE43813.1 hypothetical protein [Rhodoferax sp.]